jgi:hypothetical protein
MTVEPKPKGGIKECLCCGLPREIYMDSLTAQQVCDSCKQHHSRDLQMVIDLHRRWWHEYTNKGGHKA